MGDLIFLAVLPFEIFQILNLTINIWCFCKRIKNYVLILIINISCSNHKISGSSSVSSVEINIISSIGVLHLVRPFPSNLTVGLLFLLMLCILCFLICSIFIIIRCKVRRESSIIGSLGKWSHWNITVRGPANPDSYCNRLKSY